MSDNAHKLARIVAEVHEQPWALLPSKLSAILALLEVRASGQRLDADEVRAAIGARESQPVRATSRGVAVLPVFGVLGQRMSMPLQISGGTSTEMLTKDFRALLANDDVDAIVLAIDSPGGACHGTDECATAIRAARGSKPIVACVSSLAASAAYWVAAQCDRVVCTPGGDVGSIGVISAHEDVSGAQQKLGVTTTLVSAGKYKAEGHPFAPLSDEARAALQRRVDECYARFVAAVAAGRGVSDATVREGYGQGRLLGARDALAAGMIDEIATLDDVLGELAMAGPQRTRHLSTRAIRQEPLVAATRQRALDDWRRSVSLSLRLLDL